MTSWPVPGVLDGERLDRAVALLSGLSRRQVNDLLDARQVSVGGKPAASHSRRVRAGETVTVEGLEEAGRAEPLLADPTVSFDVVWADDEAIVVDKPAGLVVHPGAGQRSGTLVHGLLARYPDLVALLPDQPDRPGIVHRLDKGTSGLLMVARTPSARSALIQQLSLRQVGREYLALVAGTVAADQGLVDAPLGRGGRDPTRVRVQADGREARTHYAVVERYVDPVPATLLRCRLETGRTHQIRVHLASIAHPVVGDDRYGGRSGSWRPLPPGRPFLHAASLAFEHPSRPERLSFTSPLPGDLAGVLAAMSPHHGG